VASPLSDEPPWTTSRRSSTHREAVWTGRHRTHLSRPPRAPAFRSMAYDQPPAPPPPHAGAQPLPWATAQAEPVVELDDNIGNEAATIRAKKRGRPPSPFSTFFVIGKDKATMQCTSCLIVMSHQTSRYEAHLNKCSSERKIPMPSRPSVACIQAATSPSPSRASVDHLPPPERRTARPAPPAALYPAPRSRSSSPFRPQFEIVCRCCTPWVSSRRAVTTACSRKNRRGMISGQRFSGLAPAPGDHPVAILWLTIFGRGVQQRRFPG
jgi:hypothetical protein